VYTTLMESDTLKEYGRVQEVTSPRVLVLVSGRTHDLSPCESET